MLDPRLREGHFAHAADHPLGSIERRRIRQLGEAHEVLLVLRRHETGRRVCEAK